MSILHGLIDNFLIIKINNNQINFYHLIKPNKIVIFGKYGTLLNTAEFIIDAKINYGFDVELISFNGKHYHLPITDKVTTRKPFF